MKLLVLTCTVTAIILCSSPVYAEEKDDIMEEQSTESSNADMTLNDDAMKADAVKKESGQRTKNETMKQIPKDSQQHTIADFIIHPLIALKPRVPAAENGKQAVTASSSTPAPWQIFNFSPGQSLGSSVSSLAGTVTGWLGNRIQLPGLLETPVRESATISSTTSTVKPDIVVRIQQHPSTKKPLISASNNNIRRNQRPNRFNVNSADDSEEIYDLNEYDDLRNFNRKHGNRRRYQEYKDDDDDDDDENTSNEDRNAEQGAEDDDEEEAEEEKEDEKPVVEQNNKRRVQSTNDYKRRNVNNQRRRLNNQMRKPQLQQEESAEEDQYDDDDDDDDDEDDDQGFYYNKNRDTKRSKNELNFIQRGQQNLLKQIRQFTGGQTPAEVGNSLRESQIAAKNKRRQPAILLINHKGQTYYVAPELLQVTEPINSIKLYGSQYPQPPLTVPNQRKGQPIHYITLPWSQLGISPSEQIVPPNSGLQSQRLILQIPQKAIDNMQSPGTNKKKPSITGNAVPLLDEASIMNVLKPPRIPPSRIPTTTKPTKKTSAVGANVFAATKTKQHSATRIRPVVIADMAPAALNTDQKEDSSESLEDESNSSQFIVIGDESDGKQFNRNAYRQILNYFNQNRVGRQLNSDGATPFTKAETKEQLIPVQIVTDAEEAYHEKLQTTIESHTVADNSNKKNLEEAQKSSTTS